MLIVAYLSGSISGARISARIFKTKKPTEHGSLNPGATNMYRIGGLKAGVLTLFIDVFKAVLPLWGSYFLGISPIQLGFIAIACCLGHIFPIFHAFKGGKAVATAFGSMLPIGLDLGVSLIITWFISLYAFRYSSLASIISVALSPVYVWLLKPTYVIPVSMLAILILIRHTPNIRRLILGTEPKYDQKR